VTRTPGRLVVIHTAFIGDIILALPLVQVLRSHFPHSEISFVTTPTAAGVLHNHPAIDTVILFDKRGTDRGVRGVVSIAQQLRNMGQDIAIVPHRSLRSAALAWFARIPRRIGFSTSSGRFLYTETVIDNREDHEIRRNLSLLSPISRVDDTFVLPALYPDGDDCERVNELLPPGGEEKMIALAPGSIWNTKRWPHESFAELGRLLAGEGYVIVLIGSRDDVPLCAEIAAGIPPEHVISTAGECSILQSAEVIRRCRAIVTNDSAPMHLGVSMGTPVVAIFGATDPKFGFAPQGRFDTVVETRGLPCRPCSIHGGARCPIGTFECMRAISPGMVRDRVHHVLIASQSAAGY
jgi:lipopolysaccharide heptosyltransferase II